MEQSHKHESMANGALSRLIERVMHGRETDAESTQIIDNHPALQPDIVITAAGRSPVVIEAEYLPANSVEKDAYRYFEEPGLNKVCNQTHPIEAAIAVRYPKKLAQAKKIDEVLKTTRQLEYCALYPNKGRFPTTGWLKGSVCDLADLIHLVDVPESAFDKAADDLRNSIDSAVSVLQFSSAYHLTDKIFSLLGLAEVIQTKDLPEKERRKLKNTQTRRIAGAIIANALIFHERIAGAHQHILPVNQICGHPVYSSKKAALKAWEDILNINYWPIFDTASRIIGLLPANKASSILKTLTNAAERIHEDGLLYEHDLTGHVFQRLIIDRKYLAAYYTLPESAALLASLAVSKMNVDWIKDDKIRELKIADFACGTGALLSAVYDQIANRYERTGGDPEKLHEAMMEQVLYGFDVLPFATHLTASILSGKEPATIYDQSCIFTMPFGRQKDKTVKIGSLEFLDKAEQEVLFHTGNPAKQVGSKVEATIPKVEVPNNSLDLVIMNPPFTRPTNHEGEHADIINPAVAAFGASDKDMDEMGKRLKTLGKGTCWHGNAGIASAFVAIANKKIKPNGILALVLPLTAAAGSSWQNLRDLLAEDYTEVEVVSLADAKCYNVAFSADTSMADCLIIARKKSASISSQDSCATRFISLLQRPDNFAAAGETAKQLTAEKTKRKLEGGPFGGNEIFCGKEKMGETITANVSKTKPKWNLVRIQDFELIQTAYQLTHSKLHLPRLKAKPLAMTELKNIGKRGLLSRDITGPAPRIRTNKSHQAKSRLPRGPFDLSDSIPKPTDTYPALWNHNCEQERSLLCEPDRKLIARPRMEDKANQVWHQFAGRCHLTVDFGLASQSIAVAFTKEPCIGGRAWPNVNFPDNEDWDYAFSIWGNSTLGLLSWWWHGSRQQPGRAIISITASQTLPVLDFRALDKEQIKQSKTIFDDFKNKRFLPAYLADEDPTRELLDRRVLCDWLGFDQSTYQAVRQLAAKWCAEPSVHGGKQRSKNTLLEKK